MDLKIAVCVPAGDMCHTVFAYSLALAIGYMAKNQPDAKVMLYTNNGTVLAENRTALAKLALREGADWLVWFDSDMRFPKDAIERLVAHAKPIVAANYPTRRHPFIETVSFVDDQTQQRVYTTKEKTGLEAVAAVGFGAICIHRSVFEAMDPPWFFTPWDEVLQKWDCGEDIYFCRKARSAGFEVLIDHDLSKDLAHIGSMEWTHTEANTIRPLIPKMRGIVNDDGIQEVA